MLVVFGCEYQLTDGEEDFVELGLHRVAQLEAAGALHGVYALVVGQVDGDGLAAGVAVSGVVDHVIDVEVGGGAGHESLVLRLAGQLLLQGRKHGYELGQVLAALGVLEQDEGLVGSLGLLELVVVALDRADDEVYPAVLHVHPGQVTGEVIVSPERLDAFEQIVFQARILGQVGGLLHELTHTVHLLGVLLVVPYGLQFAVLIAAEHCVPG